MKRAMFIKKVTGFASDALLYKLSDPLNGNNTVIVAATTSPLGNQQLVHVFPATDDGDILSWEHIAMSRGTQDHEEALKEAGYEIL